jgi:all-trans-retinol 13,14-reductase
MNKKLVIIGGGITGLSSAIAWAMNVDVEQNPVIVLEKNPIIGGYVTSFKREGYLFDTSQLIPDVTDILKYFKLDITFRKFKGYYMRLFLANPINETAKTINIPSGLGNFEEMLIKNYPEDKKQIQKFLSYSLKMYNELFYLKVEPGPLQLLKTLLLCPKIIKYSKKTFREYYNAFGFTNPEIREIFDSFAAFSALPAERVTALLTVSAINTTLQGSFRPKHGFIEFPIKLGKKITDLGGEICTKAEAEKILIENNKVKGVRLKTGEIIDTDYVITTIDPKIAMKNLVGLDLIRQSDESYAEKVEKVKMSASAITINLGLDNKIDLANLGLDCGYNILTTGKDTFEKLFKAFDKNEPGFSDTCFHTAVICPSLTTGSKPSISIRVVPMPISNWIELRNNNESLYMKRKEEIADFFIDKVEKYMIPELKKHIIVKDITSPATYARYSGSPTGSNYDMAPYPDNFGRDRLKMRTPIEGLFQPKFSHGIWPSLQAGLQVIDMILGGKIMHGNSRYKAQ